MEREILFRGKRVDDSRWIEGSFTIDCNGECEILHQLKTPHGGFQFLKVIP